MKRLALFAVLAVGEVIAAISAGCSAMTIGSDTGPPEAAPPLDGPLTPDGAAPSLVVVNGMDQALGVLNDTNIRVCLGNGPDDYPLPEDPTHPVPLSNYPGIPTGGGVDLGARPLPPTIYAISAKLQNDNYPNSPNGSARIACDKILGGGAIGKPNIAIPVSNLDVHAVVVLLDGTSDAAADAVAAVLDSQTYGPQGDGSSTVYAQIGAFGEWPQQPVTAEIVDPADASTMLAAFDAQSVSGPASVAIDLGTFDNRSLRLTSGSSTFEQSFQSIQSISDPTTSPSVFYGVRANFLFLLLGAQGDAAAPSFGDPSLHIVAIPYVP